MRAIAVTAVVLFHASLASFSRGFLGVDIFFVISGFLITGLILDETEQQRFSLVGFYERRIRRIFPAAIAMLAVTSAVAWHMYPPNALSSYGKSLISAALFSSNWFFLSETSYFGYAAESKSLLHTWTLSVEEQFYLALPLFLMFVPKRRQTALIISLAVCSIIFARHLQKTGQPDAMFFNSFSRFWEPLLGVISAFIYRKIKVSPLLSVVMRNVGLLLIIYGFYRPNLGTAYDEILISCLGASVFLIANPASSDWSYRLVSSTPFVTIGRLSYSIYLWHWPILVFARMKIGTLSSAQTVCLLALTLGVSSISFLLVETPFRSKRVATNRKTILSLTASATIAMGFIGAALSLSGLTTKVSPEIQAINDASNWNMDYYRCFDPPGGDAGGQLMKMANTDRLCTIGNSAKTYDDFIVWGDSHAFADLPPFADLASEHGLKGITAMYPGCPSLINTENRELGNGQNCPHFFNSVLNLVQANDIRQVFMVDRWSLYLLGEMKPGEKGLLRFADNTIREKDIRYIFVTSLERTVEALGDRKIVFLKEPPTQKFYVTDAMATNASLGEVPSHLDGRWTTLTSHRERNAFIDETFADLARRHSNVTIIDPTDEMCRGDLCPASRDGLPLYWDDDHLNHRGASLILKPLISPLLSPQQESSIR